MLNIDAYHHTHRSRIANETRDMPQTRAKLQQALNALLTAPSPKARMTAGEHLVASVHAYLSSSDSLERAPVNARLLAWTREVFGEAPVPATQLSDDELERFNQLLPWGAMTVDQKGRTVGHVWSADKRGVASNPLDPRQVQFDKAHPLAGRHVMEVGCFEGIHTLGLLLLGARVTAFDGRVENVVKTLARLWAYGRSCEVALWNVEGEPPTSMPEAWDVLHHIGVLYHLSNPVEHLNEVLPRTRDGVLLDTHVASTEAEAAESYNVGGRTYRFRRKPEPYANSSPFAGMKDHAKYLLLEDLTELIGLHGFGDLRIVSDRNERNGRRVTIWAFR